MAPLLAAALVGGAGLVGYLFVKRNAVKGQVKGQLAGVTDTLTKGKTYAIMTTLTAQDGRGSQKAIGTLQVDVAAANVKNVYELLGFKVLSAPAPRNAAELGDFLQNPSIWLLNGQWAKETAVPALPADFILSQSFVTLPVQ